MTWITCVNEKNELIEVNPATKESRPLAQSDARCHCEREPGKIWFCCLAPGSTCLCQQK